MSQALSHAKRQKYFEIGFILCAGNLLLCRKYIMQYPKKPTRSSKCHDFLFFPRGRSSWGGLVSIAQ